MKQITQYIVERIKIKKREYKYFPTSLGEFQEYIIEHFNEGNGDLTDIDTSKINSFCDLFSIGENNINADVKIIDVSGWKTGQIKHFARCFYGCWWITDIIGLDTWDTSSAVNMSQMFENCASLKTLDVEGFNMSQAKYIGCMFDGCRHLETIDISKWKLDSLVEYDGIFDYCGKLKSIGNIDNILDISAKNEYVNLQTFVRYIKDVLSSIFDD